MGFLKADDLLVKPSGQEGITNHVTKNSNLFSGTWSWIMQGPTNTVDHLKQLIVSADWTVMLGESRKTHSSQGFKTEAAAL